MTNTNDFISLLASKLGRSTPTSAPTPVDFDVPVYQVSDQERAATFLNNWQALGGKGQIIKSPQEAADCLQAWFGELFPDQPQEQAIVSWNLLPAIAESAFSKLNWPLVPYPQVALTPGQRHELAAQAELGVTGADWGIALSGTVVTCSNPQRGRAVSLLPPRHLAILETSKLRNNLSEVLSEIAATGTPPAALEFITGPSRTSDIEMDLSIGVHGPIEVYVLLVDDSGEAEM
ncbi:lactate utilization protein [Desulfosporosinus sp. PR]|uniref:LutC/YkgG family protein n=1 Tax=Candidatus Desulfosporosinus nitrosoreducens TaxID=3401928 RepID=UPI0027EDF6D9|nr:lactate utilization protein [Desulfosporosinus sp. PR]MDQ7096003.1 lactate utilization protein [Desulfosporosinus sp. PR]